MTPKEIETDEGTFRVASDGKVYLWDVGTGTWLHVGREIPEGEAPSKVFREYKATSADALVRAWNGEDMPAYLRGLISPAQARAALTGRPQDIAAKDEVFSSLAPQKALPMFPKDADEDETSFKRIDLIGDDMAGFDAVRNCYDFSFIGRDPGLHTGDLASFDGCAMTIGEVNRDCGNVFVEGLLNAHVPIFAPQDMKIESVKFGASCKTIPEMEVYVDGVRLVPGEKVHFIDGSYTVTINMVGDCGCSVGCDQGAESCYDEYGRYTGEQPTTPVPKASGCKHDLRDSAKGKKWCAKCGEYIDPPKPTEQEDSHDVARV